MSDSTEGKRGSVVAAPVSGSERITAVDVLRGFAIFGILLINIYGFSGLQLNPQSSTDSLDRLVMILMILLAQAKFYSLFSFLFGWGMSIQLERAVRKGINFVRLYLRRMFVLLLFGLLHGIFLWPGDILTTYAVLGTLLILFRKTSPRRILIWVVVFLLLAIVTVVPGQALDTARELYAEITAFMRAGNVPPQSIYSHGSYWEITQRRMGEFFTSQSWFIYWLGNVFAMMLLGLYAGKRRIFHDIEGNLNLLRKTLWVGLVIGLVFNAIAVWVTADSSVVAPEHQRFVRVAARTIGAPALMLFYVSGLVLLMRKAAWRTRLSPLAPVGRMALSNYLFQSVVVGLLFYSYGLGLYGEITPTVALIIVIITFLVQVRVSEWWMERYRFGPAEWLWRTLTYGRLQPLRRERPSFLAQDPSRLAFLSQLAAKLDARFLLAVAWIILIVWAGALYAWNGRLNQRVGESSFTLFSQDEAAALPNEVLATATPVQSTNVEPQIQAQATPVTSPVEYRPSAVAASGDVQAMTAAIDVDLAFDHLETLTGPEYAGRLAGSAGGRLAGEYIADMFATYGLQPASLDGTFFQAFPITYTTLTAVPDIEVTLSDGSPAGDYTLYEEYSPVVVGYAGSGQGGGPVHWVNHCRAEDFADLTLAGKVVYCTPEPGNDALVASTRLALEYGAAGLLLLTDRAQRPSDFANRNEALWVPETIPAMRVYPPLSEDLLDGSGMSLKELLRLDKTLALDTEASLSVEGSGPTKVESRNVLGVLPGRDPDYDDEVIIVGAHYDHMGTGPDGTVWAGANDNASGVAALLEIARSWQSLGFVPRRTVLFAAWDAEEWGLIGSRYYVENPSYPLDDTLASFQLDMIGAGPGELSISGDHDLAQQQVNVAGILGIEAMVGNLGRSDHVSFLEAGVPATLAIWRSETAPNTDYHRPADRPEVIEPERLEAAMKVVNSALLDLAESEPAIEQLVNQRAAAATEQDKTEFLRLSRPDQVTADSRWLTDLQTLAPAKVQLILGDIEFLGELALADVTIQVTDD
ncbi:MAG: M20/M25/M40 family metallo-hydrolase, partial [Chloroflexota bacterium]